MVYLSGIFCLLGGIFCGVRFLVHLGRDIWYWTEMYLHNPNKKIEQNIWRHIWESVAENTSERWLLILISVFALVTFWITRHLGWKNQKELVTESCLPCYGLFWVSFDRWEKEECFMFLSLIMGWICWMFFLWLMLTNVCVALFVHFTTEPRYLVSKMGTVRTPVVQSWYDLMDWESLDQNAVAFLGAVVFLRLYFVARASMLSDEYPICKKCGYDLRGNVSKRCPECGSAHT